MISHLLAKAAKAATGLMMAVTVMTTSASAQLVEWRGIAYVTNFTSACSERGWSGNPQFNIRFRPSGLGENGTWSGLSFFNPWYAFGFYQPTGRFDRTWRAVDAGATGNTNYTWENVRIRILTQSPNNTALRATTPQVRMIGEIRGFETMPDCTASFEATMMLRR